MIDPFLSNNNSKKKKMYNNKLYSIYSKGFWNRRSSGYFDDALLITLFHQLRQVQYGTAAQ